MAEDSESKDVTEVESGSGGGKATVAGGAERVECAGKEEAGVCDPARVIAEGKAVGAAVLTIMLVGADDGSTTAAMTPLKTSKVKPLPPGTARKYKLRVVVPPSVEEGKYLLFVKVETKKGGADTNAGNNSLASRKSLTVR